MACIADEIKIMLDDSHNGIVEIDNRFGDIAALDLSGYIGFYRDRIVDALRFEDGSILMQLKSGQKDRFLAFDPESAKKMEKSLGTIKQRMSQQRKASSALEL